MKRIRHNDLTHYFLRDHEELPQDYLASCEKFFKELSRKHEARKRSSLTGSKLWDIVGIKKEK